MDIFSAAASAQWAMMPDSLEQLLNIAARENDLSPEAVEAYKARSLENTQRAKVKENSAIIYLQGPLFKRANMFTEISGATSYETAALDFNSALDNSAIQSIILYMDTPGGEAFGCDEFANMVFSARGKKPITAFVSGMAASAGYWIASAADRIVVSDLSILGSIGVVASAFTSAPRSGEKRFEFVSSQSPNKRPDLETDAGRAQVQRRIDAQADVFISAVARNRGIPAAAVIEKFGQGGVEVGAAAVALGMADAVGSFDGVVSDLSKRGSRRAPPLNKGIFQMSENKNSGENAVDVAKIQADAMKTANTRIEAILNAEGATAAPLTAKALAFNTSLSSDEANKVLAAVKSDMDTSVPASKEKLDKDAKANAESAFIASKAAAAGINLPDGGAAKINPMADAVAKINK